MKIVCDCGEEFDKPKVKSEVREHFWFDNRRLKSDTYYTTAVVWVCPKCQSRFEMESETN